VLQVAVRFEQLLHRAKAPSKNRLLTKHQVVDDSFANNFSSRRKYQHSKASVMLSRKIYRFNVLIPPNSAICWIDFLIVLGGKLL
jgi:hypothetical protein